MCELKQKLTFLFSYMMKIILAQEKADMYKYQQTSIILSDDDIISKYHNAFKALTKRSIDTPRHICVSCERLCYKRNVSQISKLHQDKCLL